MDREILQKLERNRRETTQWFEHLHRHPELSMREENTAQFLASLLRGWGYRVETGIGKYGLVASLKSGGSSRSLGLRADFDALPIQEINELPYQSTRAGVSHLCGHDGHSAMLLAAGKYLAETYGCTSRISEGVPGAVLVNRPEETRKAYEIAKEAFGAEQVVYPGPTYMGSEDFAFMLQQKPGTYCFIGNGDTPMVHHPEYVFNREILTKGAAYWVALTEGYLHGSGL